MASPTNKFDMPMEKRLEFIELVKQILNTQEHIGDNILDIIETYLNFRFIPETKQMIFERISPRFQEFVRLCNENPIDFFSCGIQCERLDMFKEQDPYGSITYDASPAKTLELLKYMYDQDEYIGLGSVPLYLSQDQINGHAMTFIGINPSDDKVIIKNSYGKRTYNELITTSGDYLDFDLGIAKVSVEEMAELGIIILFSFTSRDNLEKLLEFCQSSGGGKRKRILKTRRKKRCTKKRKTKKRGSYKKRKIYKK